MKQEINLNDFVNAFVNMNRDYYSSEGYMTLFDFYDEIEGFDLDVIAICCEVSEYDEDEITENYKYLVVYEEFKEENKELYPTDEELNEEYLSELVKEIEQQTTLIKLTNGSYLVWDF